MTHEAIDGIDIEEYKVRVSGTLEMEEDLARLLRLDGRVVALVVCRVGKAEFDADEEAGTAVRKDVLKAEALLPLTGNAREQAISFMRDPGQNLIMVPWIDPGTGEVRLPKEEKPEPTGPIDEAIDDLEHDLDELPDDDPRTEGTIELDDQELEQEIRFWVPGPDGTVTELSAQEAEVELARFDAEQDDEENMEPIVVPEDAPEGLAAVADFLNGPEDESAMVVDEWPDPRDGLEPKPGASKGKGDGPGHAGVSYDELLNLGPSAPAGGEYAAAGQTVGSVHDR